MSVCPEIHIAIGPMFGGKSTWLIQKLTCEKMGGSSVIAIKFDADTRYVEKDPVISTHDKLLHDAVRSPATLFAVHDKVKEFDVIGIDEGQFFGDLVSFVTTLVTEDKKKVYVASLDANSEGKKFGHVLDLIPIADTVKKHRAVCMKEGCRKKAIFSHRKIATKEEVVIGGNDKYSSLCRECYHDANKENNMLTK